jgi:uncharacterized protein
MASAELLQLHKLHQIDVGIVEVKKKAGALEAGKKFQADLEVLQVRYNAVNADYHRAHGEQKDLELSNKQIEDKIKSIDQQLFSGKVTNPKEVDALETQKKSLAKQSGTNDERILEYWDEVPKLEAIASEAKKILDESQKQFDEWRAKAVVYKKQLEANFQELSAKRPDLAKTIQPALLMKYDAIRAKHGGIGMATVTKQRTCEECGSAVAEMHMDSLRNDRVVQCEECHRILYWTSGLI